jgi:hypothetical protein
MAILVVTPVKSEPKPYVHHVSLNADGESCLQDWHGWHVHRHARRVHLNDFAVYRQGRRWSCTLTSASATIFAADVTDQLMPDDVGSNGFGVGDVAASFAGGDLDVTLCFPLDPAATWVEGVLVSTVGAELSADGWRSLPGWDGSPFRFCLDSGAAVLATAEAFADLSRLRSGPDAFELAARVAQASAPIREPDRVYFNADVYCYDCWALGEPGQYQAIYIDMAT